MGKQNAESGVLRLRCPRAERSAHLRMDATGTRKGELMGGEPAVSECQQLARGTSLSNA
jgi:hypothetical protein